MKQTTNAYLMRVLDAFHRSRGQPRRLERARHHRGEALRFVKDRFPPGSARAGEPFASGVEEDGIVVPFQADFAGSACQAKAILFDAAQAEFQRPGVEIRDGRIAIGLGFLQGPRTLEINLLPGLDRGANVLVLYDQLRGKDLPVNLEDQRRNLREQGKWVKMPIQLLKIWKVQVGLDWPGLALEGMVIAAFAQPYRGEVKPAALLRHVLVTMRPRLLAEEGKGEVWRELLPPEGALTMARHFKSLLRALEQNDLETIKMNFPMT